MLILEVVIILKLDEMNWPAFHMSDHNHNQLFHSLPPPILRLFFFLIKNYGCPHPHPSIKSYLQPTSSVNIQPLILTEDHDTAQSVRENWNEKHQH